MNATMLQFPAPSEEMRLVPLQPMFRGALNRTDAAIYLGVCKGTVTALQQKGRIQKTSYGTYPVISLNAHLESEVKKGKR